MNFLNRLNVGARLAVAFAIIVALMIILGGVGISRMRAINAELDHTANVGFRRVALVNHAATRVHENSRAALQMVLTADPSEQTRFIGVQAKNKEAITKDFTEIQSLLENDEGKKLFADVVARRADYVAAFSNVSQLVKTDHARAQQIATAEMVPLLDKFIASLDAFLVQQQEQVSEAAAAGASAYVTGIWVTIVAGLLIFAVSGILGYLITRSITLPLRSAVESAKGIAQGRFEITASEELGQVAQAFSGVQTALVETRELKAKVEKDNEELQANIMELLKVVAEASDGNLTVRAPITAGALGNVADAFNTLLESLQTLLSEVRTQIGRTNDVVESIRDLSRKMASGATHQSRELDSASQLVQRMSADIERVSERAGVAAAAAKRTEESAHEGTQAVHNVISGMDQLRANVQAGAKKMKNLGDRSMEITSIVSTISRISEQTNMLALNAAIEAARAGEHGRGFSVVAEEVRKLAERTAGATQEIDKLVKSIHLETNETVDAIEQQTQVVEQESALVGQAGESLMKIRQVSGESATVVVDISNVARQQAEGTGHVVKTMGQISAIARSTQEGAEGTVATVTQLATLSNQLRESVNRFKVA
jgi:methyl-accepting chemotaxis protein